MTDWHYDNNHNFTVQVSGSKDWEHSPGHVNSVASRSLKEVSMQPKNRNEQLLPFPPSVPSERNICNLQPGSLIYLPPGYWHAVRSVGSHESFSVDLRIGNVIRAKWASEALFAVAVQDLRTDAPAPPLMSMCPELLASSGFERIIPRLSVEAEAEGETTFNSVMERVLKRCPMPRAIPFEIHLSNGMQKSASLEFLIDRGFVSDDLGNKDLLLNPMVSLRLKQQDGVCAILEIFSESSLSGMEYLNFALLCDLTVLDDTLRALVQSGKLHVQGSSPEETNLLARVLVHANVLTYDSAPKGSEPVPKGSRKGTKRKGPPGN